MGDPATATAKGEVKGPATETAKGEVKGPTAHLIARYVADDVRMREGRQDAHLPLHIP